MADELIDRDGNSITKDEWIEKAKKLAAEDLASAMTFVLTGMLGAKHGDLERADKMAHAAQAYFQEIGHARCAIAVYELTDHLLCELSAKLGGLEAVEHAIRTGPPGSVFADWADEGVVPDGDGQ